MLNVLLEIPLLRAAVIDLGIQWVLWLIASYLKTEIFYDLAGSLTFLLLSWLTLNWGRVYHTRQVLQTLFVTAWSLRLGSFLFVRVINDKGIDRRFNRARNNPALFFVFWTIQAAWIWITLLPTMILNVGRSQSDLNPRDYIGWALWLFGFLFEAIADKQKSEFKSDPTNQDKWIQTGLWRISRHPNYFGEIVLWFGLFLSASSVFHGKDWLSLLSPAFVALLLIKVSGIPLLEKRADRKWGDSLNYQQYKRATAKLIPFIW